MIIHSISTGYRENIGKIGEIGYIVDNTCNPHTILFVLSQARFR
jgi:hypothetical protein